MSSIQVVPEQEAVSPVINNEQASTKTKVKVTITDKAKKAEKTKAKRAPRLTAKRPRQPKVVKRLKMSEYLNTDRLKVLAEELTTRTLAYQEVS